MNIAAPRLQPLSRKRARGVILSAAPTRSVGWDEAERIPTSGTSSVGIRSVPSNLQPAQAGCFIAGTLVHTREGLKPIEQIQVGDWVLTKPENGEGERTYKRVTKTFRHENREVWRLEIYSAKELAAALAEKRTMPLSDFSCLIGTPNHPFWVNDRKGCRAEMDYYKRFLPPNYFPDWIKDMGYTSMGHWLESKGWTSLQHLKFTDELEMADGELAVAAGTSLLYRTYEEGIAGYKFEPRDFDLIGTIDLRNGQSGEFDSGTSPQVSQGYMGDNEDDFEFFKATVYNLEVEDCHSYYVGTRGIWVHNTSGGDHGIPSVGIRCAHPNLQHLQCPARWRRPEPTP